MFTLIIIIIFGYLIYKAFNPSADKRGTEDEIEEAIRQLPDMHIKAKPATGFTKLWYGKGYCLDEVHFHDGKLKMSLQNGKRFSGRLKDYSFYFVKYKGNITITLEINGNRTEFYYVDSIFSKEEWKAICGVMLCAGKTYNSSIIQNQFGTMSKIQTAATVGKLIYQLSKL